MHQKHHELVMAIALEGQELAHGWSKEELIRLSSAPDNWADIELVLGGKNVSSMTHFGCSYCLSQDRSLLVSSWEHWMAALLQGARVRIKPALEQIIRVYGALPLEEHGGYLARDILFPPSQVTANAMMVSDAWSDKDKLSFDVHVHMDLKVPCHRAGFMAAGHSEYEKAAWEWVESQGFKCDDDLKEARSDFQVHGGNAEPVRSWMEWLTVTMEGVDVTRERLRMWGVL